MRTRGLKWLLSAVLLGLNCPSFAEEASEYSPQKFFSSTDDTTIFSIDDRQPLQRIYSNNESLYMTQDGDIYDEDVASLIPPPNTARSLDYSFSRSKYTLGTKVYKDYRIAFYSGCRFRQYQKKLVPVKSSCTYKARKNESRGKRIEWEHVVPAWAFGHQLQCWQDGGRAHCRSKSSSFRQMEADLHNLVPAIGEINGDRSNYRFQMIEGETRPYGKDINVEIDFPQRTVEPPDNVFGDIARTYFYMSERYGFKLSNSQTQLFRSWNNLDPVDEWEGKRNKIMTELQGNDNSFVTNYKKMSSGGSTNTTAPNNTPDFDSNDPIAQLFALILQNQEGIPYFIVVIAGLLYAFYLRRRKSTLKKD